MARHWFAGGANDTVENDKTGRPRSGVTVTVWSAKTGGTSYTDLLDSTGAAVTSLTSDSGGFLTEFQGPDGVTSVWLDAGSVRADGSPRRFRLFATDIVGASGYVQPSGGIPRSDMTSDVRASLSRGDAALQAANNLADVVNPQSARASLGLDSGGLIPVARLGSGTASSATVLYGDQVFRVPPTGGGGTSTTVDLVATYGMVADAKTLTLSTTAGNATVTASASTFASGDVGKSIVLPGAGTSGACLVTTIATRVSGTQVTLTVAPATTVAASQGTYGTDNGPLLQAWYNAVPNIGGGNTVGATASLRAGHYLFASTVSGKQGTRLVGVGTPIGTEGLFDAEGTVVCCATPGAPSLQFYGTTSIWQNGATVESVNFWDVTKDSSANAAAGVGSAGTSTAILMRNVNRWKVSRCSFVLCGVGVQVNWHLQSGAGGDNAWWYLDENRYQGCVTGVDQSDGCAGLHTGGDFVSCGVGINLGQDATPTRIQGVKFDIGQGHTGIYGRSWLTSIHQCAFELFSQSSSGTAAVALDLDGTTGQLYYGSGVSVMQCTFNDHGGVNPGAILLGSNLKRAAFVGNAMFGTGLTDSSQSLWRRDSGDQFTGAIKLLTTEPSGTFSWTPGAVSAGGTATQAITVSGARVGDAVAAGYSATLQAGLILTANVTAADTVTVSVVNITGSSLTPPAGTLKVKCWRD